MSSMYAFSMLPGWRDDVSGKASIDAIQVCRRIYFKKAIECAVYDSAFDGESRQQFIDEAYSLISEEGKDSFRAEAMQVLLKRAEDNRDRLIVILVGYSDPMKRLFTNGSLISEILE